MKKSEWIDLAIILISSLLMMFVLYVNRGIEFASEIETKQIVYGAILTLFFNCVFVGLIGQPIKESSTRAEIWGLHILQIHIVSMFISLFLKHLNDTISSILVVISIICAVASISLIYIAKAKSTQKN